MGRVTYIHHYVRSYTLFHTRKLIFPVAPRTLVLGAHGRTLVQPLCLCRSHL